MSRLKLAKKLKPAKKAWKNFSNTLQTKFNKLNNIPKAIKSTLQRLLSTFHSLSSHHILPSKSRNPNYLTNDYRPYPSTSNNYYHFQRKNSNFAAIRIDDLVAEAVSMSVQSRNKSYSYMREVETSRGKEKEDLLASERSGEGVNTIEDAWKVVVAKSPQLQVDQKAEEFIRKFREDMRLQKERSMLEFLEKVARSA